MLGHALALGAVSALILTSVFAAPRASARQEGATSAGADSAALLSMPAPLAAAGTDIRVNSATSAQWVRTSQEVPFWSGPDDRALLFSTLPSDSVLRLSGPYLSGRVLVYYAGDGASRQPGPGWVDAGLVQPTNAPPRPNPAPTAVSAIQPTPAVAPAPVQVVAGNPPHVTARHIAVLDEASNTLLYDQGAHVSVAPASVTKIATAIVALQRATSLDQPINPTISGSYLANSDGSSVMGIEPGQTVSLRTLLYGLMLPSGNDAAEQIALSLGGSRDTYVGWMNDLVTSLGLTDTHFANPSGMDARGHYSSAYDMAALARFGMQLPAFREFAGARTYEGDGFTLYNLNRLLGFYDGADGVKIGYTDAAGKTIVASATRNGHRVYVSLMNSQDLSYDSATLLDWVWDSFRWPTDS